ncbi:MAG: phosphatidylglycerophosphatase A [Mailhella sp.]|nr:phosphatidylglycerophosphatase A [Mailhella sp.]
MMFEKYSSHSPTHKKPMTLAFAFSSLSHMIATFFGAGVLRPASGTWGSLAALLVYMALENIIPWLGWVCLIIVCFFAGVAVSETTGNDIGVHDHSSIVIDEVFAVWAVLLTVPSIWEWQFAAFGAFRFFDIVKIPPAKWFDTGKQWQNGWGVMLDDAVAAIQAIVALYLIQIIIS